MNPDGSPATTVTSAPQAQAICKDFQNGKCARGRGCRFSHEEGTPAASAGFAGMGGMGGQSNAQAMYLQQFAAWQQTYGAQYQAAMQAAQGMATPQQQQQMMQLMANPYAGYNALNTAMQMGQQQANPGYAVNPYAVATQICKDYTHGLCSRGALCKFSHDAPVAQNGALQKCSDFQRGVCTRGASCRYSHDDDTPDTAKPDVCRDFLSGVCTRGDNCRFRHGQSEEECRDFKMGACLRENCKFLHSASSLGQATTLVGQAECRDFKMGNCARAHCKFRHGEVVPVLIAKEQLKASSKDSRDKAIKEMQALSSRINSTEEKGAAPVAGPPTGPASSNTNKRSREASGEDEQNKMAKPNPAEVAT